MTGKKEEKPFGWIALGVAAVGGYLLGSSGDDEPSGTYPQSAFADYEYVEEPAAENSPQSLFGPAQQYQEPEPVFDAPAYFANCSEARAAGAAPVRSGDPGYAPHLDRDRDGIGCE